MTLHYVELNNGRCGLSTNKAQTLREEGTGNVKRISFATKDQVEWIRAMGGYVPGEEGTKP